MSSAGRPRHPKKDLEKVCQLVERAGWRVEKGSSYFKAYCPCGLHKKTIHLSPSGGSYERNLTHWLRRQPCWQEPS